MLSLVEASDDGQYDYYDYCHSVEM